MEMSTSEQQAQKTQEEMKQAAEQGKQETKQAARESMGAARKGFQEFRRERKPISAAMTAIETAPKPLYLGLTAGSILASLLLYGFRKRETALFVGQWAPTFLALGLYSKLVSRSSEEQAESGG